MVSSPNFNQISPDQAVAICTKEQAVQLRDYDHHSVNISGRPGLLLTSEWEPLEKHIGPFVLTVVFHHVAEYPMAPEHIQAIADELKFKIRGQAR